MVDPESAYCWHCGAWLPDSQRGNGDGGWGDDGGGDGFGNGNGNGNGNGYGDGLGNGWGGGNGGWGNGKGSGFGRRLPLCADALVCAAGQT